MSYTVKDKYHTLTFKLKTDTNNTSNLKLKVYKSTNHTTPAQTYTSTSSGDYRVFTVNTSDFNKGDVLDKFILSQDGTTNLWDTHEGLDVLVDGEVYQAVRTVSSNAIVRDTYGNDVLNRDEPIHSQKFALKFDNKGEHEVQVVYKGNQLTGMSYTDVARILVDEPSGGDTDGAWSLVFVDKTLKTLTYGDKKTVQFKLTRGGTEVVDETVEIVPPTGVATGRTNTNGICGFSNISYPVGTYRIGAYHVEGSTTVADTYKTITIKKGNPTITFTDKASFSLGEYCYVHLREPNGNPIGNARVTIYENGKKHTKKTSASGNLAFKYDKAGTRTIKVIYSGNKNMNAKSIIIKKRWS